MPLRDPNTFDPSFHIRGAQGAYVWGADGARLIDLTSGWNVVNAGWGNSEIVSAFQSAITQLAFRPSWASDDSALALEERFSELAPEYFLIPSCSGAEAVDNALKIARMATGQPSVLSLVNSYHGSSTGAALACGYEVSYLAQLGLEAFKYCVPLPKNASDLSALECILSEKNDIGAFIVETVTTNAGCEVISNPILQIISDIASARGILIICDDIGTGLNRTGSLFSFTPSPLRPDIFVMGKALTNGLYPLSLCLVAKEILGLFDHTAFASTYAGAPAGCIAALATLAFHETSDLGNRATESGRFLREQLESSLSSSPLAAGLYGRGLELAIHIRWCEARRLQPRSLLERLREQGVFATVSSDSCHLMIMPPLTVERKDLATAADIVVNCLTE